MAEKKQILDDKNLRTFGSDYIKIIANVLRAAGKNASGDLIKSLDFRLQNDAQIIRYALEANDYFQEVDEGRKAGSYPPIAAIARWARIKGIDEAAAFPIARRIYKFGIKPANILDKATRQIEDNPSIISRMENNAIENIEEIISEMFDSKDLK